MERRLLLDVVVGQRAAVLELLAREDQALLVRGDALLVLDLRLDHVDRVRGFHLEGDGLARQRLDKDLHVTTSVSTKMNVRRQRSACREEMAFSVPILAIN